MANILADLAERLVEKQLFKYRREACQATLTFWGDNNKEEILRDEAIARGIKTAELLKELET